MDQSKFYTLQKAIKYNFFFALQKTKIWGFVPPKSIPNNGCIGGRLARSTVQFGGENLTKSAPAGKFKLLSQ